MEPRYLTAQDLNDFEERYPGAADFLRGRELIGERKALQAELDLGGWMHSGRLTWITERLTQLADYGETK